MALDKSIKSGKEHRKPYKGAKAIDKTCRNHGSCPYCQGNRKHKEKKKVESTDKVLDAMKRFNNDYEKMMEELAKEEQ